MTSFHLRALAMAAVFMPASMALSDSTTLQQGMQALKSGNASQAIKLFSAELSAPDRTPEQRAKAFYLRAKAHYAAKQPALAMNDAASALWFNKLSQADAADAATIRGQALAEAMTSAAHTPARAPEMPTLEKLAEKTPPRLPPPSTNAAAATPARPVTAAVEPPRRASAPEPPPTNPETAEAPPTRPFTTTTIQPPPVSVVATVPPEQSPAAPNWTEGNVKREQLATVSISPEKLPARAVPKPAVLPPPRPIVTGLIEKPAPPIEADDAPAQALPWQTQSVRAASIEAARPQPEPPAAPSLAKAQSQRTSDIVTGAINRPQPAPATPPPPAQPTAPAEATPQPPAAAPSPAETNEPAENQPAATESAIAPSLSAQGIAAIFASDNPMAADVARADELQRARYERIRQMNAARGAGNP